MEKRSRYSITASTHDRSRGESVSGGDNLLVRSVAPPCSPPYGRVVGRPCGMGRREFIDYKTSMITD